MDWITSVFHTGCKFWLHTLTKSKHLRYEKSSFKICQRMGLFLASNECWFSKSSLSTDNRGNWNFLALKDSFLKTQNLSTELWNYLHKFWALFYFKAFHTYPLTNPLHCSLARKEPLLREKAITRQCENWEFKQKFSLEFVVFFGAFYMLKKKKKVSCFLPLHLK